MKLPPHIKGSPIIGHYKRFKEDPVKLILDSSEQCGDIFIFKMLNKNIYFVNHPDYIEHVLQTNHRNYVKTPATPLRMIVGNGIFTSDGDEWLKRRKLYQPALNNNSIKSYTSSVLSNTNLMLDHINETLREKDTINISQEMTKVTISIISETLFSTRIDIGTDIWSNIATILEWVGERRIRHPFVVPVNWPTKQNKKFISALDALDQIIYKIIEDKKKNNTNPDDLLSRFMNPDDDKLALLNPKELRDEVMTIFLAGHETSANVLSWVFYMLGKYPEIQDKVYQEVQVLGNRELTYEDLRSLNYTSQVLDETMRLFPPAWHFGRSNLEEDKIGDYIIPKGSAVRISPFTIQRKKEYWTNPNEFDPSRFDASKKHLPYTFIPFGAGPRLCAGRNFAMMEMLLIVAKTIKKFKFEHQGEDVEMAPLLTLRPKTDVLLKTALR